MHLLWRWTDWILKHSLDMKGCLKNTSAIPVRTWIGMALNWLWCTRVYLQLLLHIRRLNTKWFASNDGIGKRWILHQSQASHSGSDWIDWIHYQTCCVRLYGYYILLLWVPWWLLGALLRSRMSLFEVVTLSIKSVIRDLRPIIEVYCWTTRSKQLKN